MAKKKTTTKRQSSTKSVRLNPRGVWSGAISFGLVNIPVELFSSKDGEQLSFNMLDKRDNARIGYKQINKVTGKEVERTHIVKGYQYEKDQYVLMTDADFEKANIKGNKTIEIEDFVDVSEVDIVFFDKPYYILPKKGAEKGYALLQRVLQKTGKAGIAKIVLHKKQHLAALIVRSDYIVLELLRFADQVLQLEDVESLNPAIKEARIFEREVAMAKQLVEGMTSKWDPSKYKDTYKDDMLKIIEKKAKSGKLEQISRGDQDAARVTIDNNILDLTSLLRKSLAPGSTKKRGTSGARKNG